MRGLEDELTANMEQDIVLLVIGVGIVFIYVWANISSIMCDVIENRIWLSAMGIVTVGLGFFTACGVCQLLQIYASPMHKILPFLLLGIGIDDMFVIVQAFQQIHNFYEDG